VIILGKIPTRDEAYTLLRTYMNDEALLRHAYAVEGVMRHFARLHNEDEEIWGVVGLLHDIDYEMYPNEHCTKAGELLRKHGIDETIIHAIMSHGWGICTDVEPISLMEKVLFTIDELTGLIWAAALMRPSKSTMDMELSSLKKKFKDKRFAAGCSRDTIAKGAEMLGWSLDELLQETLYAMREVENAEK